MLDPERILALAEDMRVTHRKRVHHAGVVIDSLILSALQRSTDTEGRWLDAHRTYEMLGGKRSGATSFRNQVRKLVPVMHRLLRRRLTRLAARSKHEVLRGRLEHFRDVLIPDGCAFKIAKALSGVYAGTGTDAEASSPMPFSAVRAIAVAESTFEAPLIGKDEQLRSRGSGHLGLAELRKPAPQQGAATRWPRRCAAMVFGPKRLTLPVLQTERSGTGSGLNGGRISGAKALLHEPGVANHSLRAVCHS